MKIVKQILLFIFTCMVSFLVCEVYIRFSEIGSVSATEFYDDIGRGRRADLDYVYFNEGFGINRFNESRYIGENHPANKNGKNTKRIVLMGDSYVESFQIFDRNYFGNIAENILNRSQKEYEYQILNFGRSGFDIGDIYAYQKTFAEKFDPDIIIYMLSSEDLELKYSDPLRPKTVIENDSLWISFDFKESEIRKFEQTKFLTQHSGIVTMVNNCRKKLKKIPLGSVLLDKIYTWFYPESNGKENQMIEKPVQPVTEKIIQSLDKDKVIIMNRDTIPLPASFVQLCNDNNLQYVDLSIPLNGMKTEGFNPNYWKATNRIGHWNQEAHRMIGAYLANHLQNNFKKTTN